MKLLQLDIRALLIFLLVFTSHFLSKVSYITDSRWTLHTAHSMLHKHNAQLDEYKSQIEQNHYYAIEEKKGHLYYTFPIGTSLLCTPFLYVLEQVNKRVFYADTGQLLQGGYFGGIELFLAALFVALATVFLYYILKHWQLDNWLVYACVIVFAFGTSAWSTASRGLFAHGPSMLLLLAGLYSILKAERQQNWLWLAGPLFTFAYITRPTNSISLLVFGLYVLWVYRLQAYKFIVPGVLMLATFFAYTYRIYDNILTPYYLPSKMGSDGNFLKGLLGNLLSPSRGIAIYSPVFILLLPLLYVVFKQKKFNPLVIALLAVVVLHTYIISSFNNWYAGWCFGARYFAEAIPFMVCLLALGMQVVVSTQSAWVKKTITACFAVLAMASCYINYTGANKASTFEWNYKPVSIDDERSRVWDWNDIQFLR